MPEYEMPIEEQLKILVKRFASLEGSLGERFDKVEARFDKVDERLERVDERLERVDERLERVDERLEKVDERLGTVDERLGGIDEGIHRIQIRLDETHAIAKMALEAIDASRDSMDQKFAGVEKKQKEEIELLKSVIVHVRKRVEVVERRRRS